jgi:chemotaxis protein methyltransferase CheR
VSGDLEFDQFRVFLEKSCGILLGNNKQYLVSSRLNKLMEQQGLKSLGELVRLIQGQSHRGLREQVIDAMTTNETLWFRDTYPFEVLKSRVLPELLKSAPGQRLRIWSAACSSGQEPYSLSMTVDEYERSNPVWPLRGVCRVSDCSAISTSRRLGAGSSSRPFAVV